jgi:hypothetical protein
MYYLAVVILLNRPFIVNGKSENENVAARRCTEAAKTIVDVSRYVRVDDIMHFGHTAGKMHIHILHIYICVYLQFMELVSHHKRLTNTAHRLAMTIMQASFIHLYNSAKTTAEISAEAHKYLEVALIVFQAIWARWPDAVSDVVLSVRTFLWYAHRSLFR